MPRNLKIALIVLAVLAVVGGVVGLALALGGGGGGDFCGQAEDLAEDEADLDEDEALERLEDLADDAPEEIRDDMNTFVEELRAGEDADFEAFLEASENINEFLQDECDLDLSDFEGAGGGGGDDDGGGDGGGGDDGGGDDGGGDGGGADTDAADSDPCSLATEGTAITLGQVATSTIEGPGDVVTFNYVGDGLPVDIAVNQTDGTFDPVLTVCDPGGAELARDDDGGGFPNALLSGLTVDSGDEVKLVVSGFSGESSGDFELSISG